MANVKISGSSGSEVLVVIEHTTGGELNPHGENHAREWVKWLARLFASVESLPPGASCLYHARFQEKLLELFMQLIVEMGATFSRVVQVASEEEAKVLAAELERDYRATMSRVRALEAQLEGLEDVGEEEEDTGDEGSDEELPDESDSDEPNDPDFDLSARLDHIFGGGEEDEG